MKLPKEYTGELICPCCGSGWAHCPDTNPDTGERFSHWESCARYRYSRDLCTTCEAP